VKGFSEALIEDFRVNAPHVKVAVVMPGHIGTDIVSNSRRVLGGPEPDEMTADDVALARVQMGRSGMPVQSMSDDDIRGMMKMLGEGFKSMAPVSAAQAATIILDAVKAGKWRILVGDDAHRLDEVVRANPEGNYEEGGVNLLSAMQPGSEREVLVQQEPRLRARVRRARVQQQRVDEDHVARSRSARRRATGCRTRPRRARRTERSAGRARRRCPARGIVVAVHELLAQLDGLCSRPGRMVGEVACHHVM
jgi:hypothetical protein